MIGFLRSLFIAALIVQPLHLLAQIGYPIYSDDISVPGSHSVQTRVVDSPEMTSVQRSTTKETKDTSAATQVIDVQQLSIPKKARDEYEKAFRDFQSGKTQKGIGHLQNALKIAPNFYDAHFQLGLHYVPLDQAQAEQPLIRAAELNPRLADPLVVLGFLYLQTSRLNEAIEVLDRAVELDPTSARPLYYLGSGLYTTGQMTRAEKVLKKSLSLDPTIHPARLILVNIYLKGDKPADALQELEAYLKEEPQAPETAAAVQMRDQLRLHLQARKSD
jgi:tetratricopeptide (TPR) repeat protein